MIFISYRRADSLDIAGRLYDRLRMEFGSEYLFKDIDNIAAGDRFPEVIQDAISRAKVMLVLIGPGWLTCSDTSGSPRLMDPTDYVRVEVEQALEKQVRLIPVLLSGAVMPRATELPSSLAPMTSYQAAVLRADPDFNRDVDRLLDRLRDAKPALETQAANSATGRAGRIRSLLASSADAFSRLIDFLNEGNALILGASEVVSQLEKTFEQDFTREGIVSAIKSGDPRILAAVTRGWYASPLSGRLDEMHETLGRHTSGLPGAWSICRVFAEMLTSIIRDAYGPIQFHRILTIPPPEMWTKNQPGNSFSREVNSLLQGNAAAYYVARYEHATRAIKMLIHGIAAAADKLPDRQFLEIADASIPDDPERTRTGEARLCLGAMRPFLGESAYTELLSDLERVEEYISKEAAQARLGAMASL